MSNPQTKKYYEPIEETIHKYLGVTENNSTFAPIYCDYGAMTAFL